MTTKQIAERLAAMSLREREDFILAEPEEWQGILRIFFLRCPKIVVK